MLSHLGQLVLNSAIPPPISFLSTKSKGMSHHTQLDPENLAICFGGLVRTNKLKTAKQAGQLGPAEKSGVFKSMAISFKG